MGKFVAKDDWKKKIVDLLKTGPKTTTEISNSIGLSKNQVSALLSANRLLLGSERVVMLESGRRGRFGYPARWSLVHENAAQEDRRETSTAYSDAGYLPDEEEVLAAVAKWRSKHKRIPSVTEVYYVLLSLGYRKVDNGPERAVPHARESADPPAGTGHSPV